MKGHLPALDDASPDKNQIRRVRIPAQQCINLETMQRIVSLILEVILQDHARKFMPSSSHLNRSCQTRFAVNSNLVNPPRLLRDACNLKESLSSLDISHTIRLRSLRECAISSPQIDQRGHWLELLRLQHVNFRGC